MKTGSVACFRYSRLPDARSEKRMSSLGCRFNSFFIVCSSSPLTIRIENFLSRRLRVFVRIAADVIPSVS